jgi:uncharacterized OB-fold protein
MVRSTAPLPDPRPLAQTAAGGVVVSGSRCEACGYVSAFVPPRCAECGQAMIPAQFGPAGHVWSSTVVRIPVGDRIPPYGLAYVDLDDGPRVLVHVAGAQGGAADVGSGVELVRVDEAGDLVAEVVDS